MTLSSRISRFFIFPFIAFLLSRGMASLAAWKAGFDPLKADTWIRWDSGHYLKIAERGYEFVSCQSIGYSSPNDWCGNTAWFPGYPLLIRFFAFFFGSYSTAAAIVPPLFFFLTLLLIWNKFLKAKVSRDTLTILTAAAVFPGVIYDHAAFPISLLTFLLVFILSLLRDGKLVWAGCVGFFASWSYTIGFLTVTLPVIQFLLQRNYKVLTFSKLKEWLKFAVFPLFGLGTVFLYQWRATGAWDAFFKVQSKYGYGQRYPLSSLMNPFVGLLGSPTVSLYVDLQSLCVLFLMGGLIFRVITTKTFAKSSAHSLILGAGLVYWLFPHLLGGSNSIYRSEALLLPCCLLLDLLPKWLRIPLVLSFAVVGFYINGLFFRSVLV